MTAVTDIMRGMDGSPSDEQHLPAEGLPYVSFNQLRSFHAVAITGSVTAAAKLLHVGQPTVTTQLRQLESTYKVELAHRLHNGIRLTETGQKLLTLTEQLFQIEADAVDLLRGVDGRLHGRLRIGGVAPHFLMPPVTRFREANPLVDIDVTLNDSMTIAEMIADCVIDVGVIGHLGLDARFLSIPFSRQELVVFVRADHPWAERGEVSFTELAEIPLIMRKGGSTSRQVFERALGEAGLQARTVLEVDREGATEAVRAGLGATIATTAEITADTEIVALTITDGTDLYTDAFVVCLKARQSAPLIEQFLATAARFHTAPVSRPEAPTTVRRMVSRSSTETGTHSDAVR